MKVIGQRMAAGFRQREVAAAVAWAVAAGLVAVPVAAQDVRVEVTGSNIRRVDAETSLPVSIIRAEDLARQGITTAEQVLQLIPASQSLVGVSQGVGLTTGNKAEANLRGLGDNKTLVLLNGRRIANHAYDAGSVDLNSIPLAAIDRIEVLRDGASAIYGTDAIGGVINFILRKDFQGVEVSGEAAIPEDSGGEIYRASLVAGWGSLAKDGWNVFGTIDYRKQEALRAIDREFSGTGIRPDKDSFKFSGTGFPANVSQGLVAANPYHPGCRPELGSVNLGESAPICRFDYVRYVDNIPENEQVSLVGKATFRVAKDHEASIEYVRAQTDAINRVAPTPVTGLSLPANSPYFPGAGSTPAVAGIDPTQPVGVNWRTIQAGPRTNEPESVAQRLVAMLQGTFAKWDYQVAATWSKNEVEENFTDGYVQRPLIVAGVTGTVPGRPGLFLNPFNNPTATEAEYLNTTKVIGRVIDAEGEVKGIDGRISGELFQLPAGPLSVAVGAEYREEEFKFDLYEPNVRVAQSSGLELATDVSGSRDVTALFAEFNIPIVKSLEAQLAIRHDDYSDFGSTTNPKIALRWQPMRQVVVRSSYNTGFRAPTLYEIHQPEQLTFTSDPYDDPLLCPGGNPVAGANPARDCGQQFRVRQAGNANLQPEESKTFTLGVIWEPIPEVSIGVDYWKIKLNNQINVLGEQTIFGDPVKYADRYFRCGAIAPALAAGIPDCFTGSGALDPRALAYVNTPNDNLGDVKTAGYDFSIAIRPQPTSYGRFSFQLDGTYVDYYDYQREKGGDFVHNVGAYQDASPVFRWQHAIALNWSMGPWGASLVNRYKSGYTDQDPSNDVGSYSVFDASLTYAGFRNTSITFGIRNLLDEEPPFTNQGTTFQVNYDPRFTDPLGRTYWLRASYAFK